MRAKGTHSSDAPTSRGSRGSHSSHPAVEVYFPSLRMSLLEARMGRGILVGDFVPGLCTRLPGNFISGSSSITPKNGARMQRDDERQYMIGQGGRELGPFTLRELAERRLTPDMLVWYEGLADWVRIHEIPELRGYVGAAAKPTIKPPHGRVEKDAVQPPPVPPAPPAPHKPSGWATALGWIFIVVGGVCLLGVVAAVIALALDPAGMRSPLADSEALKVMAISPRIQWPVLLTSGLLTLLQISGGYGLLMQKRWGRVVSFVYAYSSCVFNVGLCGWQMYGLTQIVSGVVDVPANEQAAVYGFVGGSGCSWCFYWLYLLATLSILHSRSMAERLR
jgi:hypothetical protein